MQIPDPALHAQHEVLLNDARAVFTDAGKVSQATGVDAEDGREVCH
jgi:hypothetical protein